MNETVEENTYENIPNFTKHYEKKKNKRDKIIFSYFHFRFKSEGHKYKLSTRDKINKLN